MLAFFRSETARSPWAGILFGFFLALLVIGLWETTLSHAAYTVTTETDSESGSLREVMIRDGRRRIKVEIKGEVEISADERGIERLGEGAFFTLEEKHGRELRRFEATPGAGGTPKIAWFVDRQLTALDADGQKWLTRLLRKLYRTTGHGAEQRVARMLAQGGVPEVLSEISKIGSDQVARIYFEQVLAQVELSDDEWPRVLRQMAREMGSDHELGRLMQALPASVPGGPAADAWLVAAGSIGSDYELRKALAAVVERPALGADTLDAVLKASIGIGSDAELSSLLRQLLAQHPIDQLQRPAFDRALSTIGSDHERDRVLAQIQS